MHLFPNNSNYRKTAGMLINLFQMHLFAFDINKFNIFTNILYILKYILNVFKSINILFVDY